MVAALSTSERELAICVTACEASAEKPGSRFLAVGGDKTPGDGSTIDSLRAFRSFRAASSRRWMASRSTSSSSSSIFARHSLGTPAAALLAGAAEVAEVEADSERPAPSTLTKSFPSVGEPVTTSPFSRSALAWTRPCALRASCSRSVAVSVLAPSSPLQRDGDRERAP